MYAPFATKKNIYENTATDQIVGDSGSSSSVSTTEIGNKNDQKENYPWELVTNVPREFFPYSFDLCLLSSRRRQLVSARFAALEQGGFSLGIGVVKTMGAGPVMSLCNQEGLELGKDADMKVRASGGRVFRTQKGVNCYLIGSLEQGTSWQYSLAIWQDHLLVAEVCVFFGWDQHLVVIGIRWPILPAWKLGRALY